jgi:hypothetical protein
VTEQSETKPEAPSGAPTQSPEDVMKRIAGIPKTPEELEAEREAMEQERLEKTRVPGPVEPSEPAPVGPNEPAPQPPPAEPTSP